ncbi:MAG: S41 family peptidase [Patescibacteria group bacterium]|nr:S41 family peptidase [Patescibacteria group bacterium]
MKIKKITNILLVLSLTIFIFGAGYRFGQYQSSLEKKLILKQTTPVNRKDIDFNLFWETWEKVEERFIEKNKIDPKKMYYGAIKGMVNSLEDPYTFFLTPEENKQSKDDLEGKFEGIGAQLGLKNGVIIIVAPLKNSPAEKAGVKAGDYILKVDNQPTNNWTLNQAVSKIRGPKGTKVKLTLKRNDKEINATIVRDVINVPSIELSYEKKDNKKIAYLDLNQFGENTNDEWDKTVIEIQKKWQNKEIVGLIIDLRDNPGGYLDSSVYIASEFLPLGKTIVKQESTVAESKTYRVYRQGQLTDIPLVILINKGSASASEILAGSLRDHKRAKLVGEKTFGKGSVQEALDLKDGAGLHVTVAKWILPNGDWINSKGIDPEIKVENKIKEGNTLTREDDKQLDKAIDEILK